MEIADYITVFAERLRRKRDVLLSKVQPTTDGTCFWEGCTERATTHVQFGQVGQVQECFFCWKHHHEVCEAVLDLANYDVPEEREK